MVIRSLSIFCFLLGNILNLIWVFTIYWASCVLNVDTRLVVDVLGVDTKFVVEVVGCCQVPHQHYQLCPFIPIDQR